MTAPCMICVNARGYSRVVSSIQLGMLAFRLERPLCRLCLRKAMCGDQKYDAAEHEQCQQRQPTVPAARHSALHVYEWSREPRAPSPLLLERTKRCLRPELLVPLDVARRDVISSGRSDGRDSTNAEIPTSALGNTCLYHVHLSLFLGP